MQKDAPTFERVEPPPTAHVRVFTGPLHQAEARDVIHVYDNCSGLCDANRRRDVQLCKSLCRKQWRQDLLMSWCGAALTLGAKEE